MLLLENLYQKYDDENEPIRGLSLHLHPGDLAWIQGESGCGKTTLLSLIIGENRPYKGKISVNGIDIISLKNNSITEYRRKLGIVFQDLMLISNKTVYENVALPKLVSSASKADTRRTVTKALELTGISQLFDRLPSQLSGGEAQRVAIARAIVANPCLLLVDEPTGNLDPENSLHIMKLLSVLNQKLGITTLVATHDNEAIKDLPGARYRFEDGRLKKFSL